MDWTGLSAQGLLVGGVCQPSGEDTVTYPPLVFTSSLSAFDLPTLTLQNVCWTFFFFSRSPNYDLTPKTWANTPSIIRSWLAGQSLSHYGILFTLQPDSILFTRAIAMATVLLWAMSMGGNVLDD